MAHYQGKRFADQTVELNGDTFVDCTFERCHLRYIGHSEFSLRGCTFIDPVWVWEGAVLNTIRMLAAMYRLGEEGRRNAEKIIDRIRAGAV